MDMAIMVILVFLGVPWFLFNWLGVSGVLGFIIFVLVVMVIIEEREETKLRRTLEDELLRIEEALKAEKTEEKEWREGYLHALNWVSRKIGMSRKRAAVVEKRLKKLGISWKRPK